MVWGGGGDESLFVLHTMCCRDSSAYTDAVSVTRPIKEEATEDDPCVKLTTANSLFVWVDWVQMYCTHVSKIPEEEIPFDSQ